MKGTPSLRPGLRTAQNESVFAVQVWTILRRNWWLVLLFTLGVATGAGFYATGQTKVYLASVTVQIDPSAPRPLDTDIKGVSDPGAGVFWDTQQYYQTQYEVLRSRHLAEQTVKRLGLGNDVSFIYNLPPNAPLPPEPELGVDRATEALKGRLDVVPVKLSRLVRVTFQDTDPARAARVLQAVAETYINDNIDSSLESTESATRWLTEQLEKLKIELTNREQSLHDYKRNQEILSVSMDDQNDLLRNEIGRLSQTLTDVQTQRESLSSRYKELSSIDLTNPRYLPSRELLDSGLLNQLRGSYLESEKLLKALTSKGHGPNHPEVMAQQTAVDLSRAALLNEVQNIEGALSSALAAKKQEEHGLRTLYETAKARALDLNGLTLEYRRLERAKNNTEKLYSLVLERTKESDLTRFMRFNNIRVLDQALTNPSPIHPKPLLVIALGAFVGFGLGLGAAFGRLMLDRTFRSVEDVERELELPVLAVLPLVPGIAKDPRNRRGKGEGAELAVHEKPTSPIAEAARALRTNLMFTAPDRPQKRLLITSAGPLDGKTTVACWIATALAQTGKKVLLVDCDLRRPRIHRVFGRVNDRGLTTLLLDQTELSASDLSTVVPNLDVLTAGPPAPNPAELLQSERFSQLLEKLDARYDRVILDSPPVAPVTDAAILSTRVDATLLVVRAQSTQRDLAAKIVRTLQDVATSTVSIVFNAAQRDSSGYSAYHYQYYQRDEKESA